MHNILEDKHLIYTAAETSNHATQTWISVTPLKFTTSQYTVFQ